MFLFLCLLAICSAFIKPYPRGPDLLGSGNVGEKVIITPYIEKGDIKGAKRLTFVTPLTGDVKSYAGYVTVCKKCDSNMFFWFFPASVNYKTAPVSVWLQGGPGSSSLFGLFMENGPYELTKDNKLTLRKYSWTRVSSYIFIDNPVGTGYSYTKNESCYSKNQVEVGTHLNFAIKQILMMFPEIKSNPFYVTGESYAGKYVPALAYAIHTDQSPDKINLRGLAIGNGLVDPINQLIYSDYLYQLGLVDSSGKSYFNKQEEICREFIHKSKWVDAFNCFDGLLNGDTSTTDTYFKNVTGFDYYFNYLYATRQPAGNLIEFITRNSVRKSIHVGDSTWHDGSLVEKHLIEDVMQSVRPWLEQLLEHYNVLIYNGQLDIIVAYPLTEGYLKKLNWTDTMRYKTAKRHIWRVDNEVAGYEKTAGKLTEVLVRNAGHLVPLDQPKWALDMMTRFFRESNKDDRPI